MRRLRAIQTVMPGPDYQLGVTWADGTYSVVDMSRDLVGNGVFAPLMDPALFRSVRVGERSRTVEWLVPSGGADETLVDIDADALFEMSELASEERDRSAHG